MLIYQRVQCTRSFTCVYMQFIFQKILPILMYFNPKLVQNVVQLKCIFDGLSMHELSQLPSFRQSLWVLPRLRRQGAGAGYERSGAGETHAVPGALETVSSLADRPPQVRSTDHTHVSTLHARVSARHNRVSVGRAHASMPFVQHNRSGFVNIPSFSCLYSPGLHPVPVCKRSSISSVDVSWWWIVAWWLLARD